MKNYLVLPIYVLFGWLVHAVVASVYIKQFASTKSLGFRTVHMFEIGLVMFAVFWFFRRSDSGLGTWQMALTTLVALAVIDLVAFTTMPHLRQQFDVLHFVGAYTVVVLVAILASR